jgi:hypothetical protein
MSVKVGCSLLWPLTVVVAIPWLVKRYLCPVPEDASAIEGSADLSVVTMPPEVAAINPLPEYVWNLPSIPTNRVEIFLSIFAYLMPFVRDLLASPRLGQLRTISNHVWPERVDGALAVETGRPQNMFGRAGGSTLARFNMSEMFTRSESELRSSSAALERALEDNRRVRVDLENGQSEADDGGGATGGTTVETEQ